MYSYVLSVIAYCIRIALYLYYTTCESLSQLLAVISFGLAPIPILYHTVRHLTTPEYYSCVTVCRPGRACFCPCPKYGVPRILVLFCAPRSLGPCSRPGADSRPRGERMFGWGFAPPEPCGQTPSKSRTFRSDCSVLPMSAFIMLRSARLPFAPTMWWLYVLNAWRTPRAEPFHGATRVS